MIPVITPMDDFADCSRKWTLNNCRLREFVFMIRNIGARNIPVVLVHGDGASPRARTLDLIKPAALSPATYPVENAACKL
jgi:hypothetical protein